MTHSCMTWFIHNVSLTLWLIPVWKDSFICDAFRVHSVLVCLISSGLACRSALPHSAPHCFKLHHTASHWITMHHTPAHCSTLHHTAPHCTTLHHTAPHCTTLHHTAPFCTTLHHTAPHRSAPQCTTLHQTAPHCTTLHHTAPNRNTLHHVATRCNILLQHTATHSTCCNLFLTFSARVIAPGPPVVIPAKVPPSPPKVMRTYYLGLLLECQVRTYGCALY